MTHNKNPHRLDALYGASLLLISLLLSGCDSDFADSGERPRPARGVESPFSIASANSEALGSAQPSVPFVTVDLPNRRDEEPVVHTIAEPLGALATTQPATKPAAVKTPPSQPAGQADVPQEASIRVVQQKNPGDAAIATGDGDKASILVSCESGIGDAVLERTGDQWPATITLQFFKGTKPFARLEGFNAYELTGPDSRVVIKADTNRDAATATLHIPQFVRSERISIDWVDVYR